MGLGPKPLNFLYEKGPEVFGNQKIKINDVQMCEKREELAIVYLQVHDLNKVFEDQLSAASRMNKYN